MNMKKIFRKIAKENGISPKEVRAEIQVALTQTYSDPLNDNGIIKAYQNRIPRKGEVPTPEEFIKYVVQIIDKKD